MSSPSAAPSKRRKLRKGTHSCWECKRRKMKCIFNSLTDSSTCSGCRRRGSQCVSQEFPEEVSLSGFVDKAHDMSDGVVMESLYAESDDKTTQDGRTSTTSVIIEDERRMDNDLPTPHSMVSEPSRSLAFYEISQHRPVDNDVPQVVSHTSASHSKYASLSRALHDSLPSREEMAKICKESNHPYVLAHEIMTIPYTTLDQNGLKAPESLLEMPDPNQHPVLIARHMLLLALFLQHLPPDLDKEIKGLSESPRLVMKRLADLAISLVTTNDELLGSIEGLECVMIESVYQANIGNLRRSWMSNRRAMSIAQLMGLNRPDNQTRHKVLDPKMKHHPQLMWFRIVFLDRYLCLLLGLSQGSVDRSMASDAVLANDTLLGRLERIHCVVASRILERNESNPSSHDIALTRNLDVELQRAARSLPSKWWLAPNLDIATTDTQALFWNIRRLFAQVFHYNLLNQLHLPYMLRSSSAEHRYEYSRITCVNASREVLSRFITLRCFNMIAYSCHTVDFLALMAAMTLLLAHLDSHFSNTENLLAHQYHSDRAMIEQVQENMKEVNRLNSDALSAQSSELLGRLLTIEVGTADEHPRCAKKVLVEEAGAETVPVDQNEDTVVSVHIPYFGIIKIARDGISKEVPRPQAATATASRPFQSQVLNRSDPSTKGADVLHLQPEISPSGLAVPSGISNVDAGCGHVEASSMMADTSFAEQPRNDVLDPLLQYGEYPDLAAGGDDWAFQGVDMAFFESLMRNDMEEGNERSEWVTVADVSMREKQ